MDTRAAGQYMDKLYGPHNQGYVAVAYKDKGESWQEQTFAWPKDRAKILGWAKVHADANIFICPALRSTDGGRVKGQGTALQWLWADVDMDKVPEEKKDDVRQRIKELGTLVVASGSGDNRHVYVRLNKPVPVAEHLRLNTGLRNYLYADNKQSDNSLLRLPGTTNWKTPDGVKVRKVGGGRDGTEVTPQVLLEKRTFSNVSLVGADAADITWNDVMPEGLSRRLRKLIEMTVPEAMARYGARWRAVWAVTGDLFKKGFNDDEIHTMMDQFPPALSKAADERGYDVHKDVAKRLAQEHAAEEPGDDEDEALTPEDEKESAEQQLKDQKARKDRDVAERIHRLDVDEEARKFVAQRSHQRPTRHTFKSLRESLSMPPSPTQWLIDGMASETANVIITAQYKTGKTALMVGSLIPSLVNGTPFLGRYEVNVPEGGAVVQHWNLEMSESDLVDKYIRPGTIDPERVGNLQIAHWRGQSLNILTPLGEDDAVKYLAGYQQDENDEWLPEPTEAPAQVWTVDSFAQLARMAGINSNDNDEVYALYAAIDRIKLRSGVQAFFILGHTGRNGDDKASSGGGMHATRGASAIDEAPDARWVMTKDSSGTRSLQIEGRAVDARPAETLSFDETTLEMKLTGMSRGDAAADGHVQMVVAVMTETGGAGINQADLVKRVQGRTKIGANHCRQVIEDAIEAGFVEVRHEQRSGGGRAFKMHYLAGYEKPERDPARRATPSVINGAAMQRGTGGRRTGSGGNRRVRHERET